MTFILPINWLSGWKDMDAEIVDVAPHLASVATFAIHRNDERTLRLGDWAISNVETGLHVHTGFGSRRDVINQAKLTLSKKSVRKCQIAYKDAIKMYSQLAAELSGD